MKEFICFPQVSNSPPENPVPDRQSKFDKMFWTWLEKIGWNYILISWRILRKASKPILRPLEGNLLWTYLCVRKPGGDRWELDNTHGRTSVGPGAQRPGAGICTCSHRLVPGPGAMQALGWVSHSEQLWDWLKTLSRKEWKKTHNHFCKLLLWTELCPPGSYMEALAHNVMGFGGD